jgi:hypothetical protein
MVLKEADFRKHGSIGQYTFSFVRAELEAQLKTHPNIQTYNIAIPATWPLVTLGRINKHCGGTYTGMPELPPYVAYEPAVMNVFMSMHSKQHLKRNGESLHSRWPTNFTARDIRKSFVGMTTEEEDTFMREMLSKQEAEAEAERDPRSPTVDAQPVPVPHISNKNHPCQNTSCIEDREQKAILKGLLSKRDSELRDIKQDFRDFVKNNRQETKGTEKVAQLKVRAEAAEEQCKDLIGPDALQNQTIRRLQQQIAEMMGASQHPEPQSWTNKRAYVEDANSDDELDKEERVRKKARQE